MKGQKQLAKAVLVLLLTGIILLAKAHSRVMATAAGNPPLNFSHQIVFVVEEGSKDGEAPSPTEQSAKPEADALVEEKSTAGLEEVKQAPLSVQDIIHQASVFYKLNEERMRRIAWCESKYGTQTTGSGHLGVYQFTSITWQWANTQAGFAGENPHNQTANIWTAAWLAKNQGFGHWPNC